MEFTLKEVIELVYKRLKFILLLTLLGTGIIFVINKYILNPTYTASVQLYVDSHDNSSTANLNELNYAQKVVTTYINFLRTQTFYKKVLQKTKLDYSVGQLRGMTHISSVNNTEIFEISVSSHSASDSYKLVKAMQVVAPQLINNIKKDSRISVVDPVVFPQSPSGPNVLFNTIIGMVLSCFFALALSFLWEIIDVKVKNKDELTKKYDIPILGLIPSFNSVNTKRKFLLGKIPFKKAKQASLELNQSIREKKHFIITEAYKALRINLLYTIRKEGCKKILINSPTPEDGKSTTCANVGLAIAQTGVKVLLIDCDLRKGSLHKPFYLKKTPGLTDSLSGMKSDEEVIQDSGYDNLQIISSGSIAPNPTELLSSVQMEDLIKDLEDEYDYILLDSAPVNLVSMH